MKEFLVKQDNPKFTGEIVFERRAPHCRGPRGAELMTKMIAHIEKYAPASADLKSWRTSGFRTQGSGRIVERVVERFGLSPEP